MFCLRSWLTILFIPTNASPAFILLFFISAYFLYRPCFYCSVLLLILFTTSCNWSDRCFFDFSSNFFEPRGPLAQNSTITQDGTYHGADNATMSVSNAWDMSYEYNTTMAAMLSQTAMGVVTGASGQMPEWTGLGLEWLRDLLGKRVWSMENLQLDIVL